MGFQPRSSGRVAPALPTELHSLALNLELSFRFPKYRLSQILEHSLYIDTHPLMHLHSECMR